MWRPNAIAWWTKKSPGPIVKNKEFLPLLIASIHPGSHTLLLATLAALVENCFNGKQIIIPSVLHKYLDFKKEIEKINQRIKEYLWKK